MVASASPLSIQVSTEGDRATLVLDGEIDLATQAELRTVLTDLVVDGQIHLVIDLDGVSFIDSTGLGVLIGARRRVHALHGSVTLVNANDQVMKVFTITGLNRVFDISGAEASSAS